ncbi:YheT family hydrolase [Herbaspirillum sp. YR522]|uniref:YheT family hydrolase n=1 Tax=Herbaspirillum sp. YR522 TaxID=1144342 RepID=UPI00026F9182|nr:alpha/beta fold hydrolase [Herbaspirillum sp. YR522]EJM98241.1 putative hydrolase of the alpha/beta-hydrolase [Herbaspirillum sp. YR522]
MPYIAPRWLPGGHLQTIYPATFIRKPEVAFRRERWSAPDDDFVDVDFVDGLPGRPLVVLFHGLEGSSDSHYARALMAEIKRRGWHGAIPHFRGCSGEINLAPRFYHSGDSAELDWILRRLKQRQQDLGATHFYATGVSLGGNALLRWLGESQHQAEIVDAACAVSAPLDLAGGGAALASGFNRLYTWVFLRTMRSKSLLKLAQFPGLFDRQALMAARDLYAFDNVVTAPLHGYRDTDDYWHRASARHVLHDITVPTLVLNARNDPFLPAQHLPQTAAPQVLLDYPEHGGHVGFANGAAPGRLDWLPQRLLDFLEGKAGAPVAAAPASIGIGREAHHG